MNVTYHYKAIAFWGKKMEKETKKENGNTIFTVCDAFDAHFDAHPH